MNRRRFIGGLGAAAGISGLVGTGAFTSTVANRDVTVAVDEDASAYLAMEPSDTVNGRQYANQTSSGQLALDFSSNGRGDGPGTDSKYDFDDVFTITNQGTQTVYVWGIFAFSNSDFPDGSVWFYPDSDDGTKLNDGTNNVAKLEVGETLHVGVHLDTAGIDLGNVEITATIHAKATKPSNSDATDPGDGPFAPSNLVAHYPFDGDAQDVSGNDLSPANNQVQGVSYPNGKVGKAAEFVEGDHIEVPDDPKLDLVGDSFAISLWMKTESGDRGGLIRKNMQDSWQPVYSVEFDYNKPDKVRFLLSDTKGETPEIHSTTSVTDNDWYHVVAMYDDAAEEMKLYIDGDEEASKSISVDQKDTTGNLQFGRMFNEDKGVTGQLDGFIDDVRIYDRILSAQEISALSST